MQVNNSFTTVVVVVVVYYCNDSAVYRASIFKQMVLFKSHHPSDTFTWHGRITLPKSYIHILNYTICLISLYTYISKRIQLQNKLWYILHATITLSSIAILIGVRETCVIVLPTSLQKHSLNEYP